MAPNLRHFMRMARWVRNPPSEARIKLVFGIVLICAALFLLERYVGWPEAWRINSFRF